MKAHAKAASHNRAGRAKRARALATSSKAKEGAEVDALSHLVEVDESENASDHESQQCSKESDRHKFRVGDVVSVWYDEYGRWFRGVVDREEKQGWINVHYEDETHLMFTMSATKKSS